VKNEFATPEAPKLRVGLAAGTIEIETADTSETVVEVEAIHGNLDNVKVEQRGREVVVENRRRIGFRSNEQFEVRVRAPHGSDAEVKSASAPVRVTGSLGSLVVTTASGPVQAGDVEKGAKVRSASGAVQLGAVGGKVELVTASGDIHLRAAGGGATIRSASGDVRVDEAAGRVSVQTASGDMAIGAIGEGSTDLKSASGDMRIGVRKGSRVHVDARSLSGETASEVELAGTETSTDGPLVEVKASSMSGDVRIVRA